MLAALLLAADVAGSAEVGDRTELRLRGPGTPPAVLSTDVETTLHLAARALTRSWRAEITYEPRFTVWDLGASTMDPTTLQAGDARLAWTSRRANLGIEEAAQYGSVAFGAQGLAAPTKDGQVPRFEPLPTTGILTYDYSRTTLTAGLTLRRFTLTTSAGYETGGGATAASRAALPLVSGPFAQATADGAFRRDHALLRASASQETFSSVLSPESTGAVPVSLPGGDNMLVEAVAGWGRRWSRLTETRFYAGAAEAGVRTGTDTVRTYSPYPVAEATLAHHALFGARVDLALAGRVGPTQNRLFGIVEERASGSLSLTQPVRTTAAHALFEASGSLDASAPYAMTLAGGEIGVIHPASKEVAIDAGARVVWQRANTALLSFTQSTLYVGVSVPARPARFGDKGHGG